MPTERSHFKCSKAAIYLNNLSHQKQHAAWMKSGLASHGWIVDFASYNSPANCDLHVMWGWKRRRIIEESERTGVPILVMERGHLQPRMEWTSCGFNGLGRRAIYSKVNDGGERWRQYFSHHEKPWGDGGHYVLICGQVLGDAALWGCDFHQWAQNATNQLKQQNHNVIYRPHPLSVINGDTWSPKGAELSNSDLSDDLSGAKFVVTYNSTVGVEAILSGTPTVTFDEGAMSWPMTTHNLSEEPIRPDRTEWMHSLAWSSWLPEEIESGKAWEYLKEELK